MNNWMKKLAQHYARMKRRRPDDILMVLFDIDGTILDMRYLIHHVLREFDRAGGTAFFENLEISDVTVHENHVDELLVQLRVPQEQHRRILDFWLETRWLTSSLMEAHKPFAGVMDIIRWLQMQPKLVVGLNTGRPESLRADTLRSLNTLGEEYGVRFDSKYLHMNDGDWEEGVPSSKVVGVRHFQDAGFRVIAMVDNEPANLAAVSELDGCEEILPLHAHTIFESDSAELPSCSACGTEYVLADLASEETLPQGIQFVWHGVNDRANLRQFLASDVQWGEFDVRADPETGELILHHDSLQPASELDTQPLLELEEVMQKIGRFGKSVKFDLKEGGTTVDCVFGLLISESIEEPRLWFNGNVEVLEESGFRRLRKAYPSAIVQCPIDALLPQILEAPEAARRELLRFQSWGISRFSIEWGPAHMAQVIDLLAEWGFEANIYKVPDLDGFLHAVLLSPRSITADFNFPEWHYYGRGSGQDGQYFEYSVEATSPRP